MKSIVCVPNPVLTTPAKPVTTFDGELITLVEEMKATLLATVNPKGVGLAATQVGIGLRMFLTRPTEKSHIRVFINPEIIASGGTTDPHKKLEGCLSIPHIWGNVRRASDLALRYQDESGQVRQEEFTGFMATIIQHETDHVNGILYTQRVLEQKEKLYQAVTDEDGKEVLEEIHV